MKDYLEKLIRTVEETQLVERLLAAGSTNERVKICEAAAETPEFKEFIEHYDAAVNALPKGVDYMISSDDFVGTVHNAAAFAVICIVEELDVQDIFDIEGYELFIVALEEVDGAQKDFAENLVRFFNTNEYWITDFTRVELVDAIFAPC